MGRGAGAIQEINNGKFEDGGCCFVWNFRKAFSRRAPVTHVRPQDAFHLSGLRPTAFHVGFRLRNLHSKRRPPSHDHDIRKRTVHIENTCWVNLRLMYASFIHILQ